MRPSWISDRDDFSILDLYVTPMLPTKFGVNRLLGLVDGGHLGFPIGTILAIFLSTSPLDASYLV